MGVARCVEAFLLEMLDFLIFAAVVIICLIVSIIYLYPVRMWQLFFHLLRVIVLPAVVVEQESPAAFKNQLDRLAPVACRNAPPPAIGVMGSLKISRRNPCSPFLVPVIA